MVTVSYVATLYNKRPFVPYLVAGLEAQAGDFARELIFVDDGSTDGTAELLGSLLAGRKDAAVIRQQNSGQGAALNRGFAAATGDYIKAMDGDDMLAPWATRRLLDAIAESACRVARTDMAAQPFIDLGSSPAEHLAGAKETTAPTIRETDLLRRSLQIVRMNPSAWLWSYTSSCPNVAKSSR